MSSVQQQNLINNMNIMGHPLGPHHQELPWYIVRDGMFMLARLDGLPVPGTRSPGTAAEHLPSASPRHAKSGHGSGASTF